MEADPQLDFDLLSLCVWHNIILILQQWNVYIIKSLQV